jgi:hypothetical protein
VDLSGIIFVALAIAWAVYLIPKALQHHDEIARSRGVDRFSARMRVFGGTPQEVTPVDATAATPATPAAATPEPATRVAAPRPVTREAARRAAARRRRVLWSLTLLLGVVGAVSGLGYLPLWTAAGPLALIVGFLVLARVTVRREQVVHAGVETPSAAPTVAPAEESTEPTDREDTIGLNRAELAEPDALPLEDEGSLWDPLPVTLPTYVSKPQARRTVRTIELTQTAQSSGHDPADSALVRHAEAAEAPEVLEEPGERRAAGA